MICLKLIMPLINKYNAPYINILIISIYEGALYLKKNIMPLKGSLYYFKNIMHLHIHYGPDV